MASNPPSETIYIRNLRERVNVNKLKSALKDQFEQFGHVIDVVAHQNLRMRGQAFVVFDSADEAAAAKEKMNNHEFWGRPMVIQFSTKPSDKTVAKKGEQELEEHKRQRLAAKEARQREQAEKARKAAEEDAARSHLKRASDTRPTGPTAQTKKPRREPIVDANLPPNKVLFLQNLPSGVQESSIAPIFNTFPGFVEVRLFSVRHVGFVEYETEAQAVVAKESTAGVTVDGVEISVTYAKK